MIHVPDGLAREMCNEWTWLKREQSEAVERRLEEMSPYTQIQIALGIACAMATRFAVENAGLLVSKPKETE